MLEDREARVVQEITHLFTSRGTQNTGKHAKLDDMKEHVKPAPWLQRQEDPWASQPSLNDEFLDQ